MKYVLFILLISWGTYTFTAQEAQHTHIQQNVLTTEAQQALLKQMHLVLSDKYSFFNTHGGLSREELNDTDERLGNEFEKLLTQYIAVGGNINTTVRIGTQASEYDEPILLLAFENTPHLIPLLIERGANLNIPSVRNGTILIAAARNNKLPLLRMLLNQGASVDGVDSEGNTALLSFIFITKDISYSEEDRINIISTLIRAGADVNHQNQDGKSALVLAAISNQPAIVSYLLFAGANTTLPFTGRDRKTGQIAQQKFSDIASVKPAIQKAWDHYVHYTKTVEPDLKLAMAKVLRKFKDATGVAPRLVEAYDPLSNRAQQDAKIGTQVRNAKSHSSASQSAADDKSDEKRGTKRKRDEE